MSTRLSSTNKNIEIVRFDIVIGVQTLAFHLYV